MTELAVALVAQGALLALILVVMESRNPVANRCLAALLLALTLPLVARVASNHIVSGHVFVGLLNAIAFLIGPLFLLYANAMIYRDIQLRPGQLLHILPTLACAALTLAIPGFHRPAAEIGITHTVAIFGLLNAVSLTVYAAIVLRRLGHYWHSLLDIYSDIDRINLDWLKSLAYIVFLFGGIIGLFNGLRLLVDLPPTTNALILVPFSLVMFYAVAILGFRQSSVLLIGTRPDQQPARPPAPTATPTGPASAPDDPMPKYERSGLSDDRAQRLWSQLQTLMASEPLYLDPELQLPTIAQHLGVSPQAVSEMLGRIPGVRFYDYINGLRIECAKELLGDSARSETSILEVALAAGFNTKSTFNKYFKQAVGQTPTEYRQSRR